MSIENRVAGRFKSASLTIGPGREDDKITRALRSMKLTKRRTGNDFESAMRYAGALAAESKKIAYVYKGTSYMHEVFQVTFRMSDAKSSVNNIGNVIYSVEPDLTVKKHEVKRPTLPPPADDLLDGYPTDGESK